MLVGGLKTRPCYNTRAHAASCNACCRGGGFNQAVRELVSYYVAMEEFCMEQNVGKAIEIREHTADSLTTSMVDDAFFILQKAS